MPKYQVEDSVTGKKYVFDGDREPTNTEVENYVFGGISAEKPSFATKARELEKRVIGEEKYKLYEKEEIPRAIETVVAPLKFVTKELLDDISWALKQIDRPRGAVRSLLGGESPIKGFKNPEQYIEPAADVIPIKDWNIKDPAQEFWTRFLVGTAADLGTMHLVFGTLPKAAIGLVKQANKAYVGAQGELLIQLKKKLVSEFVAAGISETSASVQIDILVAQQINKASILERTPWNIQRTIDDLEVNKGKLGKAIVNYTAKVEEQAKKQAFTKEWFKAATEAEVQLPFEPTVRPRIYYPPELPYKERLALPSNKVIYQGTDLPSVISLDYKGVPSSVAKTLPNEIVKAPTEEWIAKTTSRYPQKITDQKSLEAVGNAMAKDMGVQAHIKWKIKTGITSPEGNVVQAWVADYGKLIGRPGKIYQVTVDPADLKSQGKIKNAISHELSHITTGMVEDSSVIFQDEVKYHKAATLINREVKRLSLGGAREEISAQPSVGAPTPPRVVTPELLTKEPSAAEEVLQRLNVQTPEVIQQARAIIGEPTPEIPRPNIKIAGDYDANTTYGVQYASDKGIQNTFLTGNEVNAITSEIKEKGFAKAFNKIIHKIVDVFPIKGEKGGGNIEAFDDAITNLSGEAEKATADFRHSAKRFGVPFFIGEKYPAFKPVYMALQDAVDTKAEMFFDGMSIVNPKELLKSNDVDMAKALDALKLGNATKKEFTAEALKEVFGLNDNAIRIYKTFRAGYKYGTDVEIMSRKLRLNFEDLTSEQRIALETQIEKSVKVFDGYMNQQRLNGDWAVYVPPSKEGEIARFFNLYDKKADAQKEAALLGPTAHLYLKSNITREIYRNLTLADLESLIEASDVNAKAPEIEALRNELRKKTFLSHWIHRQNVQGYEWNKENVIDSLVEYIEGAVNKFTRIQGRINAEKAFREGVGNMTPDIRAYSRDFIDGYYNTGAIGFRALNRLMYAWKLSFKLSWLGQNLTQPTATTYPALAQYFPGLETEKVFLSSYNLASRYLMSRVTGEPHGLSSGLLTALNKAHQQGILGDQMTRFQLGVRTMREEQVEQAIGLFGRAGEAVNRTHAAIAGYRIATDKLGLTDEGQILQFMKNFVYKTQFAFGKQNLPTMITGAGNLKNWIRTAYTFRHYSLNYLQFLAGQMPWRGA